MAMPTVIQLIEKIARAKLLLEGLELPHTCLVGYDPDYFGPCTCKADDFNRKLRAAQSELKLD